MISDIIRHLKDMRVLSVQLKCNCVPVPLKDGHGERMVCPDSCPHGKLDAAIATAMVEAELMQENHK